MPDYKEKIVKIVEREFEKEPEKIKALSKEIYEILLRKKETHSEREPLWFIESEEFLKMAKKEIEKFIKDKSNERDKTILRYLVELAFADKRDDIFYKACDKLLNKIFKNFPPKRKSKKVFKKGKPEKIIPLKYGVRVAMSPGRSPLYVEVDPEKLAKRENFLKMQGIFEDTDKRASIKHDELLCK